MGRKLTASEVAMRFLREFHRGDYDFDNRKPSHSLVVELINRACNAVGKFKSENRLNRNHTVQRKGEFVPSAYGTESEVSAFLILLGVYILREDTENADEALGRANALLVEAKLSNFFEGLDG